MSRIVLWGNSSEQLRSLPDEIRLAFTTAIDSLAKDPASLPSIDSPLELRTGTLEGALPLLRIKVKRSPTDPGFRAVYFIDGDRVVFLFFANRDESTYKRLKALYHRALSRGHSLWTP